MEENTSYDYNALVAAYLSGEASPEDIIRLDLWLAEDIHNRQIFEEYRRIWILTSKYSITAKQSIDIDDEWDKISVILDESIKDNAMLSEKRNESDKGNASFSSNLNESKKDNALSSIKPANKGATIKPLFTRITPVWRVAASLIVILATAAVMFYLFSAPDSIEVYADRSNLEQTLPDGSIVTLHKGTTIKYYSKYNKERKVTLDGEAYFMVKHDEKHPFIVSGNDVRIRVLGTSFNVNTKSAKNKLSVVLTSGKVSLYFKDNESNNLLLTPGERATVDIEHKSMLKSMNPDTNYDAWKTRRIAFNGSSLSEVILTLNQVYETDIRLKNSNLSGCTLTATFNNQSIDKVLKVISETLDLQVSRENNVIFIDGTCD